VYRNFSDKTFRSLSTFIPIQVKRSRRQNSGRIGISRSTIERAFRKGEKSTYLVARNRSFVPFLRPEIIKRIRSTHALASRTQFFETTQCRTARKRIRSDIWSALARIGVTIAWNKCVYIIRRASEGASSLATPLLAQQRRRRHIGGTIGVYMHVCC